MCQERSKPVKRKFVYCYRAYEAVNMSTQILIRSIYNQSEIPEIGKETPKKYIEPFHAFRTLDDLRRWNEFHMKCSPPYPIWFYKCKLSGDIKKGVWSDEDTIETYTGNSLKIIRRIHIEEAKEESVPEAQ